MKSKVVERSTNNDHFLKNSLQIFVSPEPTVITVFKFYLETGFMSKNLYTPYVYLDLYVYQFSQNFYPVLLFGPARLFGPLEYSQVPPTAMATPMHKCISDMDFNKVDWIALFDIVIDI